MTIDEIQKCPELLPAIKRLVDDHRAPGRFLLSGSANLNLLASVTESLAGRAVALTLHPFTLREMDGRLDERPLLLSFLEEPGRVDEHLADPHARPVEAADLLRGGLPVPCLGLVHDVSLWFRGYEQTYLERDVRQVTRVVDLLAFRQLLGLVARRTAQVLKPSELARDAKASAETVSRHLGVLEASFVLTRLPPFLGNRASRLIKSPKAYVTDSGLAAHLCGIATAEAVDSDPARGALHETLFAQNLAGLLEVHRPNARLHFWHVQGRHEVDFVIEDGRAVTAIEVNAGGRWRPSDLASLRNFLQRTPNCTAAILAHGGEHAGRLGDRLWAVPMGSLLS